MKLLIDAGNTRIKWALADGSGAGGGNWLRSGTLPVERAGELPHQFAGLQGIRQVWVSNVAGETIERQIRDACAELSAQPRFIVAREAQCGVRNGYSSPSRLGCDRWAALIAAWHLVRGACLVVNSGTATTVDALSSTGEFIGGLILPGVALMQCSLRDATVQLQAAQAEAGQGEYAPFPLNTADALYSGALQASCGAVERQYALLNDACPDETTDEATSHSARPPKDSDQAVGYSHSTKLSAEKLLAGHPKDDSQVAGYEFGRRGVAPVVLSGGAAAALRDRLNVPLHIVDNLVLQGLWLIAQGTNA
jgi:type III pantothenate kinase